MATLTVSRPLIQFANPTEAQFDTMRTSLTTFFNDAANLEASNVADGSIYLSDLTMPQDDESLAWASSTVSIKYDTGTTDFILDNTDGDVVFKTTVSGTTAEALRVKSSTGKVEVEGLMKVNTGLGSQIVDSMWLLSRYRKPRLTYTDDNIVTLEPNLTSSTVSYVFLTDRLSQVYDNTMSLAATANGYDAAHTGTAVSGLKDGLTRTDNTWYFVYCVRVQGGDQANGTYSILVADTTSPLATNVATLNTDYGTGAWVYMGVIKNGWNITSNNDKIVPFIYDHYGNCKFTKSLTTGEPAGPRMASADASTSNLTYTLSIGTGNATIPAVATRLIFGGFRSSHSFELDYNSSVTGENNQRVSTLYHPTNLSTMKGAIYLDVPYIASYRVITRQGTASTDKRITLAGFTDHFA